MTPKKLFLSQRMGAIGNSITPGEYYHHYYWNPLFSPISILLISMELKDIVNDKVEWNLTSVAPSDYTGHEVIRNSFL